MSAPTSEEEQLLETFRDRVKDILKSEEHQKSSFLLRWLRARDNDLNQAEDMLRKSLFWRKENGIDHILDARIDPIFRQGFPFVINGTDILNQPVVVVPMGIWDLRKLVALGKIEEFKEYISFCFEHVCHTVKKVNETRDPDLYPITQFTTIVDWKGYSYMQLCNLKAVQTLLNIGGVYEAHYPEILYRIIFINCPSFFNVLLMMMKQILAAKTFEKISVNGTNKEEWMKACEEVIEKEQLSEILKPIL